MKRAIAALDKRHAHEQFSFTTTSKCKNGQDDYNVEPKQLHCNHVLMAESGSGDSPLQNNWSTDHFNPAKLHTQMLKHLTSIAVICVTSRKAADPRLFNKGVTNHW